MKAVEIYIAGVSRGKSGPGGWGVVLTFQGNIKEVSGGLEEGSQDKLELKAVVEALSCLKEPCEVCFSSHSNFVKAGVTQYLDEWKKNAWRDSTDQPVAYKDYWQIFDLLAKKHNVSWRSCAVHDDDPLNLRVTMLANLGLANLDTNEPLEI